MCQVEARVWTEFVTKQLVIHAMSAEIDDNL